MLLFSTNIPQYNLCKCNGEKAATLPTPSVKLTYFAVDMLMFVDTISRKWASNNHNKPLYLNSRRLERTVLPFQKKKKKHANSVTEKSV